jgi:tRNA-dihydrouridine synthase A
MRDAVDVPVTVKCRTGVDDADTYEFLAAFVRTVAAAGCEVFIVHARKAILRGLTPAQNRSIPPLDWTRVARLKDDFPHLSFVVNGGLAEIADVCAQLARVDGVMLGRAAYQNPWLLQRLDASLFGEAPLATFDDVRIAARHDVLLRLLPYVETELANGARLHDVARHLHGLFNGCAGARRFRRHLSERATRPGAGVEVLLEAAKIVIELDDVEALAACSNA